MTENREQTRLKQAINEELSNVTFKGKDAVLSRTHPKTNQEKLSALWNKEVQVPLIPLGAALFLMISAGTLLGLPGDDAEPQRELIQHGGSYYWSDMIDEGGHSS